MMVIFVQRSKRNRLATLLCFVLFTLASFGAFAQETDASLGVTAQETDASLGVTAQETDAKIEVQNIVKEAIEAYSNLELDASKNSLETALGYAPDIDRPTLARVYVSYGVLWVGGFADDSKGQSEFMMALCLDDSILLDPMLSTPDIDLVFSTAKASINPAKCTELLSTIIVGGIPDKATAQIIEPSVPPCGVHVTPAEQKQKFELPLYLDLTPSMRASVSRLVLKYNFDGAKDFKEIPLSNTEQGFGVQLSCDEHQIRVYDPATINYYIEGYNSMGQLVCGHASEQGPMSVAMSPDASPLQGLPGLAPPKECLPCAPWDKTCGITAPPALGEHCNPQQGCDTGLICGEIGVCENKPVSLEKKGPSKFYTNLTGGIGFGIMSSPVDYQKIVSPQAGTYEIKEETGKLKGVAFSGMPLRLAVGFFVSPQLAIEITGRFDLSGTWNKFKEPKSCWEMYGDSYDPSQNDQTCINPITGTGPDGAPQGEDELKRSVATNADGRVLTKSKSYAGQAWLANLRVRYMFLQNGGLTMSLFGGLGYGHVLYQSTIADLDMDGAEDLLLAAPGMFNIELGPGLAYWFNDNVGFLIEVPIDIMLGDGWAINFDVNIGMGFGF